MRRFATVQVDGFLVLSESFRAYPSSPIRCILSEDRKDFLLSAYIIAIILFDAFLKNCDTFPLR